MSPSGLFPPTLHHGGSNRASGSVLWCAATACVTKSGLAHHAIQRGRLRSFVASVPVGATSASTVPSGFVSSPAAPPLIAPATAPSSATDQDTNRTCNHGTNGRTRSRTRHNTATDQGRLRFPLGLFGSEPNLGCGSRILGRHTMPGNSLLGKVWVNRLCARRLRSQ